MSTVPTAARPAHAARRLLISTLAIVVAVFGFLVVGATSASAAPAAVPFTSDGCTLVPENPSGVVSFHDACVGHDLCYFTHAQSRSACDAAFYGAMKEACATAGVGWSAYYSCRTWAAVYYAGVRVFGGYFYNSGGVTRTQTPMQV